MTYPGEGQSRRAFLRDIFMAGAGAALVGSGGVAYPAEAPPAAGPEVLNQLAGASNVLQTVSRASLVKGDSQIKNTIEALKAIEAEIKRGLEGKKRVLIKPNMVHTGIPLCATQAAVAEGIIEFLKPIFKGEIIIGESSANAPATEGFKNYGYEELARKYKVPLIDFDTQPFTYMYCIDDKFRMVPARTTKMVFDPDTYIISAARMKTHDRIVATLSLKNLLVGAVIKDTTVRWGKDSKGKNDKPITHGGNTIRGVNFNLFKLAEQLRPHLALIDGFQGMEGEGPAGGTAVDHRIAIASTDFLAADRIAVEVMGVDWKKVGYLNFCAQAGLGQGDLAKIDIQGEKPENVKRTYRLHKNVPKQFEWG